MRMIQELRDDLRATGQIRTAEAGPTNLAKEKTQAKTARKPPPEHRTDPKQNSRQPPKQVNTQPTQVGKQARQQKQMVASSLSRDKDHKLRVRMLVAQRNRGGAVRNRGAAVALNDPRSGVETRILIPSGEAAAEQTSEHHLYGDDGAVTSLDDDDKEKEKKRCCDDLCCYNCFLQ